MTEQGLNHNRIIVDAAKDALTPLGLRRKGRSRIWLDDHGWWVGIVEFQPSSWSRTTGLNVGAMFLWEERDHISYDTQIRSHPGVMPRRVIFDPETPDEFANFARQLAESAAHLVVEMRAIAGEDRECLQQLARDGAPIAKALALGLLGDLASAESGLREHSLATMRSYTERPELQRYTGRMVDEAAWMDRVANSCSDREAFRSAVNATVCRSREAIGLPESDDPQWA